MAGASKRRAQQAGRASEATSTAASSNAVSTQPAGGDRSSGTPQSLPRFDGNRDPEPNRPQEEMKVNSKNLGDAAGFAAWFALRGIEYPSGIPKRPAKLNSLGTQSNVTLNNFNVIEMPKDNVSQYDVIIGSGNEKRGLIKAIWHSETVARKLGQGWLFDGNKIAWFQKKIPEQNFMVDLDAERQRNIRPEHQGKNRFRVVVRFTKKVNFVALSQYLKSGVGFDNSIIEAVLFMDHLMRETPSRNLTAIKKSFFSKGQTRVPLGGGIEALKGVFSSIRITTSAFNTPGLSVNVDVSNGTFWTAQKLAIAIQHCLEISNPGQLSHDFKGAVDGGWDRSKFRRECKRLSKLSVEMTHRTDEKGNRPVFIVDRILPKFSSSFVMDVTDHQPDGSRKQKKIKIADYFWQKYQVKIQPNMPLVQMTKQSVIMPLDFCEIVENQRYPFKLSDNQTSKMINFAVKAPADRWKDIQQGLSKLNWGQDPILRSWGLRIDSNPVSVKARQLPVPKVDFANSSITPRDAGTGRWRIDKMKFKGPTPQTLKSWGVMVIHNGTQKPEAPLVTRFMQRFSEVYVKHGGSIDPKARMPALLSQTSPDLVQTVETAFNGTGNKFMHRPQVLIFIVLNKNADTYNRIKKMCECRYGIVSQVIQAQHIPKCQDQYISNVCMKFHAKLGGFTSQAVGTAATLIKQSKGMGNGKTMMCIGADVSHPAPGSLKDGTVGSYAAITMSLNKELTRYAAQVQTNGFRVEMITTYNMNNLLGKMVRHWMGKNGGKLPDNVIYFRDGVSEGQYPELLNQELRDLKALFRDIDPKNQTKVTLVVASKRHHVRFFPQKGHGDRTENPKPGCLVETGVTHPYQFDFYLTAHSAIKGTARPVHYTVLHNEIGMTADELHQLVFEHSFQYIRSTTPVSIHPAVYYAHLASQRAHAHTDLMAGQGKKDGKGSVGTGTQKLASGAKGKQSSTEDKTPTEVYPLLAMHPDADYTMWYI
ncbi:Piwi domain-containing protein [Phyllosticta citribraziliensis]|uniref:Piwi domain-containing protein n=1 Tax=Phyllosticta citribraziliensis TaxID=989973 RepID=A0ABR1L3U2_9PEZI